MPVKSDWKSVGTGLLEVSLILTAVFSLATAFDYLHRYLEMFSHFRLQYFVASVLLTLAFVALRWQSYVVVGVATIALNAYLVVPWYLPTERLDAGGSSDPTPVKLLHANVLASNHDATRFIELVGEEQPDLIVMQETTPQWLALLDSIKASYPYKLAEPRDDSFGIAFYSKFPLDSTAIIESVPRGIPSLIAEARIGARRLNIISTHPMPPIGSADYGARNLQLDSVAQLASRTPEPLIVIGDLNITMWSHQYARFEEQSMLQNARRGFGVEPTWPLFLLPAMIPIDHCLVSDGIVVTDFRTGPAIGSDHLPIIVSVTLPKS